MSPKRRRSASARTVPPPHVERFLGGWRYIGVPPRSPEPDGVTSYSTPSDVANAHGDIIMVDLLRPRDLLVLTATFYGAELWQDEAEGRIFLAKRDQTALLAIDYPYQHGHEEARFEVGTDAPAPTPPVGYRPARSTRLVFEIGDDDEIDLTTEGVLAAMSRLQPVLHRLADDDVSLPGGPPPAPDRMPPHPDSAVPRPSRVRLRGDGTFSEPPGARETAIEAPYRLVISPNRTGRWEHATRPVAERDDTRHVELWHSRLTRVPPEPDAPATPPEPPTGTAVRAIWARDRDGLDPSDWQKVAPAALSSPSEAEDLPFRGSLNRRDRHILVRQSAETWRGKAGAIPPVPVRADKLWLSGLGAWLELHGAWNSTPYTDAGYASILAWDHLAPFGRDQYVRVMYPGFLFPFRHRTALVKITERKMKTRSPSVAALFQRKFLVIDEPVREYPLPAHRGSPFQRVGIRPLVTPNLDDPGKDEENFFWPTINHVDFRFTIDAVDREGRAVAFSTPLLWVAENHVSTATGVSAVEQAYDASPHRLIELHGQTLAYTPPTDAGNSVTETARIRLRGRAAPGAITPFLSSADVSVDAIQRLTGTGATTIGYYPAYVAEGENAGEVWAAVLNGATAIPAVVPGTGAADDPPVPLAVMEFGTAPSTSSDRAGGFVTPSLAVGGLSTASGPVNDLAKIERLDFDPAGFLAGVLPRLFGIFSLADLIEDVAENIPEVVSQSLGPALQLLDDLRRAVERLQRAAGVVEDIATRDLMADAEAAASAAAQAFEDALADVTSAKPEDLASTLKTQLEQVRAPLAALRPKLPEQTPFLRDTLTGIIDALDAAISAASLVDDLIVALTGIAETVTGGRFRVEWSPKIVTGWPAAGPLITMPDDALSILVEGKTGGPGAPTAKASAELRDFTLHLFPSEPLMRVPFERIAFVAGADGKAEVDVVLGEIEFVGVLSFVQTIKDLIPLDGFSDPPHLEVTPQGLTAGFSLGLPSLAVGVFSLSNLSLGADLQVPFLGKSLSVGFNFCTRERPFTLAVAFIGGGGWFLIRLAPDGLEVLELGLEAGATLSVDFGVASGSISAMIGVYLRLESDKGSLTGYFRLRGEVDVLGLISASIELYMELTYQFDTGKMLGRARITVEVEVFVFSGSVTIEAERQFAGANGDPSLEQLMVRDGGWPDWDEYWAAFDTESLTKGLPA